MASAADDDTIDTGHGNWRVKRDALLAKREKFMDERPNQVVRFLTSDGVEIDLHYDIYGTMGTIVNMIDDMGWSEGHDPIPLANVTSHILEIYKNFVEKQWSNQRRRPYYGSPKVAPGDEDWSRDNKDKDVNRVSPDNPNPHLKDLSLDDLFQLLLAANFLNSKECVDMCSTHIANMIRNRSAEEIQQVFKITKEMNEEAEAKMEAEEAAEEKEMKAKIAAEEAEKAAKAAETESGEAASSVQVDNDTEMS